MKLTKTITAFLISPGVVPAVAYCIFKMSGEVYEDFFDAVAFLTIGILSYIFILPVFLILTLVRAKKAWFYASVSIVVLPSLALLTIGIIAPSEEQVRQNYGAFFPLAIFVVISGFICAYIFSKSVELLSYENCCA